MELSKAYWKKNMPENDSGLLIGNLIGNDAKADIGMSHFKLTSAQVKNLRYISGQLGVSVENYIRTVFQIFLFRYHQQSTIGILQSHGTSKRSLFSKFIPIYKELTESIIFKDLLIDQQKHFERVREYPLAPAEWETLAKPNANGAIVVFARLNKNLKIEQVEYIKLLKRKLPNLGLGLLFQDKTNGIDLYWNYNKRLFDLKTIGRLTSYFIELTKSSIKHNENTIGELDLICASERKKILQDWNGKETKLKDERSIYELFIEQVEKRAKENAIIYNDLESQLTTYTYEEIGTEVNSLAETLQSLGVSEGVPVVIYTSRSQNTVIGLLAILKVRGIYVPIDESYPDSQVKTIVEDTGAKVLLTTEKHLEALNDVLVTTVCMDKEWVPFQPLSYPPTVEAYDIDEPSLILYTSGSTGRPKGVLHGQRQLVNRFHWLWENYPFKQGDVMGQRTMLNFLPSLWGLLGGLLQGIPTVIIHDTIVKDPLRLAEVIERHNISYFSVVPTLLKVLLESDLPFGKSFTSLRFCITAGEILQPSLVNKLFSYLPKVTLLNDYGATEMNGVLFEELKFNGSPIDRIKGFQPIPNIEAYILNTSLEPVGVGIIGELHISGVSLALRYLNNEILTDEKFIPHPFKKNSDKRMYKTGDMAKFTSEGKILVIGRGDRQTKVRGIRIELKGIEEIIISHKSVKQCVLNVEVGANKTERLVAYVVLKPGETLEDSELLKYLEKELPLAYLPSKINFIKELPRTLSGKISYSKLKDIVLEKPARGKEFDKAEGDELIATIHSIACKILEVKQLDKEKRWYAVGFDSINIIPFANLLNKTLGTDISIASLYSHASIKDLAAFLRKANNSIRIPAVKKVLEKRDDISPIKQGSSEYDRGAVRTQSKNIKDARNTKDIAIIGVSGRFPGADNLDVFWENLIKGRNTVTDLPLERWNLKECGSSLGLDNQALPNSGGFINNIERFEPSFFNLSYLEATMMDPQQRILLEECWKVIEDACLTKEMLSNTSVGVFIGMRPGDYINLIHQSNEQLHAHALTGNDMAILAARVAYYLNLKGPAVAVDTACSSSAVAIHMACKSIQAGDSEMALAGGVCILSTPWLHEMSGKLGMLSKDGQCKPFDNSADGITPSEGVGVVMLKSLEKARQDGDKIYGIIKATGINQDGKTNGITAPNGLSQQELMESVYRKNRIDPNTIDYIEAHGTGTKLGDPIEVEALNRIFSNSDKNSKTFYLGSVKANIGHPIASAAMAGLFKILLSFKYEMIPPQIHFQDENELLNLSNTPFEINTKPEEWKDNEVPRRAALSSFGFSGTNAHIVLEAPTKTQVKKLAHAPAFLVCISAKTGFSIRQRQKDMLKWLKNNKTQTVVQDLAFVSSIGRDHFKLRIAIQASDFDDLQDKLESILSGAEISGVFTQDSKKGECNVEEIIGNLKKASNQQDSRWYIEQLNSLGQAYVNGEDIDWNYVYDVKNTYNKISIPTYPFNHSDHWIKPKEMKSNAETIFAKERDSAKEGSDEDGNKVSVWLRHLFSEVIQTPVSKIMANEPLESYGLDSVLITELNSVLENKLGKISKTIFFECQTIDELSAYLIQHHLVGLLKLPELQELEKDHGDLMGKSHKDTKDEISSNSKSDNIEEVAIVGMSGRYPMSSNLDEFYNNLKAGKDCVTEIPKERWDYRLHFSDSSEQDGKIKGKWGGFVDDVDKFDSLFFNISPKEAELMDPQERLFLEVVWHALEDSGYTKSFLKGHKVGVYLGATWSEYQLIAVENKINLGDSLYPNCSLASIANRISYQLSFTGPSMAIDTMCSSSLTALHYANEALRRGEIDFAVVGGVNLSLHPYKYHLLSSGNFLSTEGKCRSFGEGGDGYVPGEGIGALILTKKSQAQKDGAPIYAMLKSTVLNHGGKTNGYTVPNPTKQGDLISEALMKARIDPSTITYLEAHGTGTPLGDPIEIKGLTKAYSQFTSKTNYCGLGSVKSNIGHLEACAGVAAITKVLLQMKHQHLVPSLHASVLNKNIDLEEDTPFYIQRNLSFWEILELDENGEKIVIPRRAAVSSFGAGGSNAHVILEEYSKSNIPSITPTTQLMVLSAKNEDRLIKYAENLISFLEAEERKKLLSGDVQEIIQNLFYETLDVEPSSFPITDMWKHKGLDLVILMTFNQKVSKEFNVEVNSDLVLQADNLEEYITAFGAYYPEKIKPNQGEIVSKYTLENIAYTLQMGREAMDERVAIVTDSITSFVASLKDFVQRLPSKSFFSGNVKRSGFNNERETLSKYQKQGVIETRQFEELAALWVQGLNLNWDDLHNARKPQKVSLPLYPFLKKRHWLPAPKITLEKNNGTQSSHPLLHDDYLVSGLGNYESRFTGEEFFLTDHQVSRNRIIQKIFPAVAYLEMLYKAGKEILEDEKLVLKNVVWEKAMEVKTTVSVICELGKKKEGDFWIIKNKGGDLNYAQGQVFKESKSVYDDLSIPVKEYIRAADIIWDKDTCYEIFEENGMHYGYSFQSIEKLYIDDTSVLAQVKLPLQCEPLYKSFTLHPSLLDGAFQTVIAWIHKFKGASTRYMPFSLKEIRVTGRLPKELYAYTRPTATVGMTNKNHVFDITLTDTDGKVCLFLKELTILALDVSKGDSEKKPSGLEMDNLYFKEEWESTEVLVTPKEKMSEIVLFYCKDIELFKNYKSLDFSKKVYWIKYGDTFEKESSDTFRLNPSSEKQVDELFRFFSDGNQEINSIVYYSSKIPGVNPEAVTSGLEDSIYPVFNCTKSWLSNSKSTDRKKRFLHIYEVGENYWTVPFEALGGFVKSMNLENSTIQHKTVSVDSQPHETMELAGIIHKELQLENNVGVEVAYRNGARFRKTLKPLEFRKADVESRPSFYFEGRKTYLVVGGLGELGQLLIGQLGTSRGTNIIVVGSSELSGKIQKRVKELEVGKSNIFYYSCDISNQSAVEELTKYTKENYGDIHGVIHCAGIMTSAFIKNKERKEVEGILAPKVYGTIYLDEYTKNEPLDFFILYSSIASTLGSAGQCDYAYGNSFMDYYCDYRESLGKLGQRQGKTLSLNWHLWEKGGMQVNEETKQLFEHTFGMFALTIEDGINALELGMYTSVNRFMVVKGDRQKIYKTLKIKSESTSERAPGNSHDNLEGKKMKKDFTDNIVEDLCILISDILKLDIADLEIDTEITEYGFESVSFTTFANRINELYGVDVMPSIFFEHSTLVSISNYLLSDYKEVELFYGKTDHSGEVFEAKNIPDRVSMESENAKHELKQVGLTKVITKAFNVENEPIAIVGINGRMPQGNSLSDFKNLMEEGNDAISEIPTERWDWKEFDGGPHQVEGKSYCRWGGFLKDIYHFDASFFSISPSEARLMDPQQRLTLQSVWKTIEDAGYKASYWEGRKVGVFMGVVTSDYDHRLRVNNKEGDFYVTTGNSHSILTNRISHFFDFHGPSEPVNTACSSSLVALDKAIKELRSGNCEMCIVGGVNIILDPSSHIAFSHSGVLSRTGKVKALDKEADGYVRSEGVGTIMLKPLSTAKLDGDHIYALIQSTNVNHGGRVNSITTPNPKAQASLLVEAFRKAKFDPTSMDYLELQGIALPMADSIEFNGLNNAFKTLYKDFGHLNPPTNYCAIGSVKNNIGHLESASGIAGLFKVLLGLKHDLLFKNANHTEVNPLIKTEDTPFYILSENKKWQRSNELENMPVPRRAGVSTFGFGGVNATVLLEEYMEEHEVENLEETQSLIFVLSAKTKDSLEVYLNDNLAFLKKETKVSMQDYVYTLQVGRESMEERIAILFETREELISILERYLGNDISTFRNIYRDRSDRRTEMNFMLEGKEGEVYVDSLFTNKNFDKLAMFWVNGAEIDWKELYHGNFVKRIAAPTYPFAQKSYHFSDSVGSKSKQSEFAVSSNGVAKDLVEISALILGMSPTEFDINKSLVKYGLDSIKGIRLLGEIQENLGVQLMMKDLFDNPSIKGLEKLIKEASDLTTA